MRAGHHFANRQPVHVAHRVIKQLQRSRSRPRALQRHVLHVIADQFADARRAIDMRDDLDHEGRLRQRLLQRIERQFAMPVGLWDLLTAFATK